MEYTLIRGQFEIHINTCVFAERNWSVYGAIKSSARSQMGHAVSDKRVYVHEALHLAGKLQKASYHQANEKWDTDSDTDASEDEADLQV